MTDTPFLVKHIHEHTTKGRSSFIATYRKRKQKDGTFSIECTGFDTKVYADDVVEFKKLQSELEDLGVEKLKTFNVEVEASSGPASPLE